MSYVYDFGQTMKMSLEEQLEAVKARHIPPRWIVGTGYKDGRKVAIQWLEEMIAREGESND
jgi:hypothetical protein